MVEYQDKFGYFKKNSYIKSIIIKNEYMVTSTSQFLKSKEKIDVQAARNAAMNRFLNRNGREINLSEWDDNTACPICGTILSEFKNLGSKNHFDIRKKRGEQHPWVCQICVQKSIDAPKGYNANSGPKRPRGWQFMAVYVDVDGNVFYKGEEQIDLKGTLEPTQIEEKSKEEKKKLTKSEKNELKQDTLMEMNAIKAVLKKGVDDNGKPLGKGKTKELLNKIKKQEKIINKL